MSSLGRQNTLYGLGNNLPRDAFENVKTISGDISNNKDHDGAHDARKHHQIHHNSPSNTNARQGGVGRCHSCGNHQTKGPQSEISLRKLLLLGTAFVLYVSVGAVIFSTLESGPEHARKHYLEEYIHDFLHEHECVNMSAVVDLMIKAVDDSEIVYYVAHKKKELDRWAFSGAFGFVISVVTTIGFGNLSPHTQEGKVVCVFYALFGIPLTLLVLRAIGQKMAYAYVRVRRLKCSLFRGFPMLNKRMNVAVVIVVGFGVMFMLPAAIFSHVEQWYYLEAIYFCFTTLSTVGFGDYVIGLHEEKLESNMAHKVYIVVSYIWILLGLSFLSLVYRIIMDTAIAGAKNVGQRTKERIVAETQTMFHKPRGQHESPDSNPAPARLIPSQDSDQIPAIHRTTSQSAPTLRTHTE